MKGKTIYRSSLLTRSTVASRKMWDGTVQYSTVQRGTVQYSIVQRSTVQYSGDKYSEWGLTSKERNRCIKCTNGNIERKRNALKIVHWNMGPTYWRHKIHEARQLLIEFNPDICIVTEANIMVEDQDHEVMIPGYTMLLPPTMVPMGYCRMLALVKEGVEVEVIPEIMDPETATIWMKIRRRGRRNLVIGAIYREHRLLKQPKPNLSGGPRLQQSRWMKILNQWVAAGRMGQVVVIGDLNLDQLKWSDPDQGNKDMVNMTKGTIETMGYHQLVRGATRSWPHQEDSLVDHLWTETPEDILEVRNVVRTFQIIM